MKPDDKDVRVFDYIGSCFAIVGVFFMSIPSFWMVPTFLAASICFCFVGIKKRLHGLFVLQIICIVVHIYTLWKIAKGVW